MISDLSDQATTSSLELQAWAEGEKIAYTPVAEPQNQSTDAAQENGDIEAQVIQALNAGNVGLVKDWMSRASSQEEMKERASRIFLATVNTAPVHAQAALYDTQTINFNYADPINERNCMHEAAASGNVEVLRAGLSAGADVAASDVYGRLPLHYACMHGKPDTVKILVAAAPNTVDAKDLNNFTPLVHAIVNAQTACVQVMLQLGALVDPAGIAEHVPLNLACQYGSEAIVGQILRYQPKILPDAEGLYPQHLVAKFGGAPAVLQMLKDFGSDMNQQDKLYQWTPAFHAASEGHLHSLHQLLLFNVTTGATDEKGLSAMYYAAWEGHLDCMQRLAEANVSKPALTANRWTVPPLDLDGQELPPASSSSSISQKLAPSDPDVIPSLSLPPPIIPLRRYGHNFLDTTKTFILLSFGDLDCDAIEFYRDSKYPAARLTISSKSSDLVPRNLALPIQEEHKNISFQIENLDTFSIDFDIFPTFGSKVIARAAASSRVFTDKGSSSGIWHLELFDPRLRAIGRISFRFQVVTPFHGIPLEITHFATYWKATSQLDSHPSNLITGSSLSGDFMRLFVQVTQDAVPVVYHEWALPSSKHALISRLSYQEFTAAGSTTRQVQGFSQGAPISNIDRSNLTRAQRSLMQLHISLAEVLAGLPPDINVELHICYPTKAEEAAQNLGPTLNINVVADTILKAVFEHSRSLRESQQSSALRNFVFSSYNADVCTALNWKQPNCEPSTPYPSTVYTKLIPGKSRSRASLQRPGSIPDPDPDAIAHVNVYSGECGSWQHVCQGERAYRSVEQFHGADLLVPSAGPRAGFGAIYQGGWSGVDHGPVARQPTVVYDSGRFAVGAGG